MNILSDVRNKLFLLLALSLINFGNPVWACPDPAELPIALDIGHSPRDPGAISARGVPEYEFNRNLAERIQRVLHQAGFENTFILTENNPEMPLFVRASLANVRNAALLLSIHHDSVQPRYLSEWEFEGETHSYSDKFQGYSLFISHKNAQSEASLAFAELLGSALRGAGFAPSLHHAEPIAGENRPLLDEEKGIYQFDSLILLQSTKVPAVLLECGVIVNRDEEILLQNPVYQGALVAAVVAAVERYVEQVRRMRCARR